jgi:hypothetical protein
MGVVEKSFLATAVSLTMLSQKLTIKKLNILAISKPFSKSLSLVCQWPGGKKSEVENLMTRFLYWSTICNVHGCRLLQYSQPLPALHSQSRSRKVLHHFGGDGAVMCCGSGSNCACFDTDVQHKKRCLNWH